MWLPLEPGEPKTERRKKTRATKPKHIRTTYGLFSLTNIRLHRTTEHSINISIDANSKYFSGPAHSSDQFLIMVLQHGFFITYFQKPHIFPNEKLRFFVGMVDAVRPMRFEWNWAVGCDCDPLWWTGQHLILTFVANFMIIVSPTSGLATHSTPFANHPTAISTSIP